MEGKKNLINPMSNYEETLKTNVLGLLQIVVSG